MAALRGEAGADVKDAGVVPLGTGEAKGLKYIWNTDPWHNSWFFWNTGKLHFQTLLQG
uniref:Uncharacterized protein n=1 Tax=Oryctolagus cuniculus TaxID=9986 RepID=G1TL57_RABIT